MGGYNPRPRGSQHFFGQLTRLPPSLLALPTACKASVSRRRTCRWALGRAVACATCASRAPVDSQADRRPACACTVQDDLVAAAAACRSFARPFPPRPHDEGAPHRPIVPPFDRPQAALAHASHRSVTVRMGHALRAWAAFYGRLGWEAFLKGCPASQHTGQMAVIWPVCL